jgi:hypothetical protein
MKIERSFVRGRMNKSVDERLLPQGEYVDAMNIRLGSTEESEIGAIENARGNELIAEVQYLNQSLSAQAVCLGSLEDSENETIYWCVHDPANAQSTTTGKVDIIVSYNTLNDALTYHVISTDDGGGVNTALNFSTTYRVNAMTFIDGLLFFTDNNNQPMRINVDRVYNEPSVKDLLVIVQPPNESPTVQLQTVAGLENYMDTRFISFAYRYKYRDGEYSALSQFSEIAFDPKPFSLSVDTYQNEGMVNEFNSASVSFNTGGENVTGIDLVFKLSNQSVVNVIEKFDKSSQGWLDNQTKTRNFTNRKIYTTLGTSEILRVFDNVPRKAQAQTIMGNRLMYGNYVDGYDVKDSDGNDCDIVYNTELVSEDLTPESFVVTYGSQLYTIDPTTSTTINNAKFIIDFSSIASSLFEGAQVDIGFRVRHDSFTGSGTPTTQQEDFNVQFSVVLTQPYANVQNFIQSVEFKNALEGITIPTNLSQCGTTAQGSSATDKYNCTIQAPLDSGNTWNVDGSGITTVGTPLTATVAGDIVTITLVAMRFVESSSPTTYLYEYFSSLNAYANYSPIADKKSLHSDRDYEVGIVYMDDFNRSTTALVSTNNTVFIPPGESTSKNSIKVTIPPNQKPPSWATRYKFVVKPSSVDYEVIYSDLFFIDPADNATYVKLEGDNQTKAAKGDRLRVKRDTDGALNQRIETVILELESQPASFISDNVDSSENDIAEPSGLYMKIKPSGFNTQYDPASFLGGQTTVISTNQAWNESTAKACGQYDCSIPNPTFDPSSPPTVGNTEFIPFPIPPNSRVVFDIVFSRESGSGGCEELRYAFQKEYLSSSDYNSLYDFVIGENVDFASGVWTAGDGVIDFDPVLQVPYIANTSYCSSITSPNTFFRFVGGDQSGQFSPDPGTIAVPGVSISSQSGKQKLLLRTGFDSCLGLPPKQAVITVNIRVFTSENLLIFETLPIESDANIYYEGSDSYPITNGNHISGGSSGDIDQDIAGGVSGEVNLSFFNCFSFGNGAESYKIRDSLAAPSFRLGERTTAVSEQDFKEAHRFADITYSGIYNADTNVNRLNEFNLGTANFKELEKSFGPIRVLDARQTDILTLQEDKISYVLSSKTLLSSPSGGGNVAAIPEVLGNQIARIEKYGISNNPESFVSWGFDKFFTDTKRGAVLQLKGSGQAEQLKVISDTGMGSWFRDYFILTPNTQKLGGYDPYMNEYVLSGNLTSLPIAPVILECGADYRVYTSGSGTTNWEVLLNEPVGTSTVNWTASFKDPSTTITVNVTYNGVVYTSGTTSASSGSFTFDKNFAGVSEAQVEVIINGSAADFTVNVGCPVVTTLNVVKVCLNNNTYNGQYIHNDYYWTQGTFDSPTSSDLVLLQAQDNTPINFAISQYDVLSGPSGGGIIPPVPTVADPVTIRIQSTKIGFDDFNFDPTVHQLRYALEPTLYGNTPADMNTLLGLSTILAPTQNPTTGVYYYDINYVQSGTFKPYLYLIYSYITCESLGSTCKEYSVENTAAFAATIRYNDCSGVLQTLNVNPATTITLCIQSIVAYNTDALSVNLLDCSCP